MTVSYAIKNGPSGYGIIIDVDGVEMSSGEVFKTADEADKRLFEIREQVLSENSKDAKITNTYDYRAVAEANGRES